MYAAQEERVHGVVFVYYTFESDYWKENSNVWVSFMCTCTCVWGRFLGINLPSFMTESSLLPSISWDKNRRVLFLYWINVGTKDRQSTSHAHFILQNGPFSTSTARGSTPL